MRVNARLHRIGNQFYTLSLVPGQRVYGERLITEGKDVWREWNPFRSKLASALSSGLKELPIREGDVVLYLGCAEGTSVSHVSDLVGVNGLVIGVDISPKAMATFTRLAESRPNILPILADARSPAAYMDSLSGIIPTIVVQDISQRDQAGIFLNNMRAFSRAGTYGMLVIKARSVDFAENPEVVFRESLEQVKRVLRVRETVSLDKFEKDHYLISAVQE